MSIDWNWLCIWNYDGPLGVCRWLTDGKVERSADDMGRRLSKCVAYGSVIEGRLLVNDCRKERVIYFPKGRVDITVA
jgi:hypothetical protein